MYMKQLLLFKMYKIGGFNKMNFSYNATQAYDASLQNFEKLLKKDEEYINSMIEVATLKGEFSIIYDNQKIKSYKYAKEMKKILNDLGYTIIEKIISEERKIWIISWEHAKDKEDLDPSDDSDTTTPEDEDENL